MLKNRQRRSRPESILNAAQRLRLWCSAWLRPRWTVFLNIPLYPACVVCGGTKQCGLTS